MGRLDIPQISKAFFATVMPFRTEEGRARYDAATFRRTIQEVLASQEAGAGARRVDYEIFEAARYAMVALVDELAIVSEWAYRTEWAQESLELEVFNTNVAGEEFFDRLNSLRKRYTSSRDEEERETILGALETYYTCLECGFKGRHRGGGEGEIESMKAGLLGMLWPESEHRGNQPLFSTAYGEGGKGKDTVHHLSKWPFVALGCGGLMLVVYLVYMFLLGGRAADIKNTIVHRTESSLDQMR
ncbi:MAG: DotU family type IV/VI secretion system protein [Planctomycetota bacterium]|jgi:type IV/VI secretion system ImpK/VasF family protein